LVACVSARKLNASYLIFSYTFRLFANIIIAINYANCSIGGKNIMQVKIGLTESDEAVSRSLHDWIANERIDGAQLEANKEPLVAGHLGADIGAILSVVLGARAVVALVQSVQAWVTHRRPKTRIELKVGKISVVVDSENMPITDSLLEHIVKLLQAADESK